MTFDIIPINDQTWIICGGRHFADTGMFDSAMGDLIRLRGMPQRVIEGGAIRITEEGVKVGADYLAGEWAKAHALDLSVEKADWLRHGHAAGPIRNQAMLDKYAPDLVVAFPGGRGTADMVRRSRKAGVDVAEIVPTVPTVVGEVETQKQEDF